uniref:NB-ARC domain-containing protein n=1 Tax=Solanum lycopersicum TaxID=4081 RepID=A0A3Q7GH27_SOLLC
MELVTSAIVVGPYMLEKLTEHHCWSIFKQKAFVDGEVPEEIMSMEKGLLKCVKFVRIFNLSKSGMWELTASFGKLIHLRYLDLSDTNIKSLRDSICKLYNLQTLRVNNNYYLE